MGFKKNPVSLKEFALIDNGMFLKCYKEKKKVLKI